LVSVAALGSWLLVTGCGDRKKAGNTPSDPAQILANEAAVKEVSDKTGVAFPPGTVVVNATDGGGRDASYGFFLWALFSPASITLPGLRGDPETSGPLLDASLQFVRGAMARRKVPEPEMALDGEWKKGGFAFSGTLIRTSQGDYLVIQQFRDR